MLRILPVTVALVLFGGAISSRAQTTPLPTKYQFSHHIAPRLQWNANHGYCGEVSLISAGMHFGQYCSQYTARSLASPGVNQTHSDSQLLVGVNDASAAKRMRLAGSEFYFPTQKTTREFLTWVKSHTLSGHVVIIGLFMNGVLMGDWTDRKDGDSDYDHIVPVLEFGSNYSLETAYAHYYGTDVITFSDNGLYGPVDTLPNYPYLFHSRLTGFVGTRLRANNPRGPVYTLKNTPENYGIAIEGVLDLDDVTIPVKLTSNVNYEPAISGNTPPTPIPIVLTATVYIEDQSVPYNVYRYDDFDKVPVAGFNAAADRAAQSWTIPAHSGETATFPVNTMSNQTVVFRAVPASAP